ncbi:MULTISPECIES: BREX-1 system adenine-specific DNA-methyltransferase PglX [Vibrio]|uniref:BREX-1 system adenine-specific DNA-methyltransferase PglX n=1 Tax=Vibrio TaxID=662 RepID=UPI0001541743|nr:MULTISPECIES: BREX-1 system adenine-specific DNA-methyltransferase PglX [Vibrio]EDL53528.1 putative type II restriction enzyme methylase subunit [Vibrio mediterranei AK1]
MNTNKLKTYAPKARLAFMDAVKKRAAVLGIYENKISEATTQGTDTLIEGRIFTRKQGQQRQQLVKRIEALGGGKDGYNQFINEMAFTWFNRFTAIRFMEVNGYLDHGFRMLSKEEGSEFGQGFEILAHAADVAEDLGLNKSDIVEMLLAGDKEEELYRELLLAQCHQLSKIMPFMFEKLDDATELLLPDNLTKTDSILKELVNDVPEDNWREIEVIGWLYQFYISEHKDAVIGKVVKKEDIPAATQLFTPNWIVKYLVQNSLGRQWLATYPDSELKDKMEYFITPAEQSDEVIEQLKAITPTSIDPEQIKVLDPACGSGHILVEVYEVLREIYLERGYRLREIPELILTKNIYGLDIDDRAAQMAAFAVLMKAREDDRRIFSRVDDNRIQLNIHSIQSTEHLDINKLWQDLDLDENKQAGSMNDLFAEPQLEIAEPSTENKKYLELLRYLKQKFIDAKNLGSLIEIDSQRYDTLSKLKTKLEEKEKDSNPTVRETSETLLPIINQSLTLSTKYDVAVANPPYMGSKGMNSVLKDFAKKNYPNSKSDLFALFIERGFKWLKQQGYNSMVTMQSWMFLSSFEKMRQGLLKNSTIETMVHMGNGVMKIAFGTNATIFRNSHINGYISSFSYCENEDINEHGVPFDFPVQNNRLKNTPSDEFQKIPGNPIAYWIEESVFKLVKNSQTLGNIALARMGLATGNNAKYVRLWHEISHDNFGIGLESRQDSQKSQLRWFPYSKGGSYRKWYGNNEHVVDWFDDGKQLQTTMHPDGKRIWAHNFNLDTIFQDSITWSDITSGNLSVRYNDCGFLFDGAGTSAFFQSQEHKISVIGYLNTHFANGFSKVLNPTMHFQTGDFRNMPVPEIIHCKEWKETALKLIDIHKADWDSKETSWGFTSNELIKHRNKKTEYSFTSLVEYRENVVSNAFKLEKWLNDSLSSSIGLSEPVLDSAILSSITLFANPSHCYANDKTATEQINLVQSSTISELLSYSIGCMMGRYSLDREGLVYAHSGNKGFKELVADGAYKTFPADDDGIIPLSVEEWLFEDDATSRFRDFVKTVWGEEHLQENLDFVAESLCLDAIKPKKNESSMETIRRYFSTQFYKDHLKTYKKRPIYWLFSSGKEKAFECLVYLHRYNESTLARMRTEYVTPLMGKLETQHSVLTESRTNASSTEQRRIDKELKSIEKKQSELRAFDEELKHLAEMKISIDLDDGVKVNYGKFGNLLADVKAIHGKNPEELK